MVKALHIIHFLSLLSLTVYSIFAYPAPFIHLFVRSFDCSLSSFNVGIFLQLLCNGRASFPLIVFLHCFDSANFLDMICSSVDIYGFFLLVSHAIWRISFAICAFFRWGDVIAIFSVIYFKKIENIPRVVLEIFLAWPQRKWVNKYVIITSRYHQLFKR